MQTYRCTDIQTHTHVWRVKMFLDWTWQKIAAHSNSLASIQVNEASTLADVRQSIQEDETWQEIARAWDRYLNLHNVWYGRLMQGNNSRIFLHSVSTDRIWHSISPGAKGVPNSSIFSVFWSWQRFKLVSFLHPDRSWPSRFLPFQNHSGKLVSQS